VIGIIFLINVGFFRKIANVSLFHLQRTLKQMFSCYRAAIARNSANSTDFPSDIRYLNKSSKIKDAKWLKKFTK